MKYKIKRKNKTFKSWYILVILIVIIILMSTSYSLWQTNLYINGTVVGEYIEPALEVDIIKPSSDRFSTNSDLTGGWFGISVFRFDRDEFDENNTITTYIQNGDKTWLTQTITISFSITIQNNSGSTYTGAQVEIEEKDSNNRITPTSTDVNDLLSTTEIQSGDSVTLTAEIRFEARRDITVGDYVNYKISFLCDGVRKYFNYRIEISG